MKQAREIEMTFFQGIITGALMLGGMILLGGCASTVPPVTPPMAAVSGKPAAMLEVGRRLYGGPCSSCHSPYAPAEYPASKWPEIVADMSERAKLSASQQEAVLAYVLAARAVPVASR